MNNVNTGGASYLELFLQGLISAADDSELGPSLEDVSWETPERCCALGELGVREAPDPSGAVSTGGRKWGWKEGLAEGQRFSRFPSA